MKTTLIELVALVLVSGGFAHGDTFGVKDTIANTGSYIMSKIKEGRFWSGPLDSDVTNDALVLALAKKLDKLTPEFVTEVSATLAARMTEDHQGWSSYFGGPADADVTSVTLLCLRAAGIDQNDLRFADAWKWFNEQLGGEQKLSTFAVMVLAPLDLVPRERVPEISPRVVGSAKLRAKLGVLEEYIIPFVAASYLEKLSPNSLITDRKSTDSWRSEPSLGHESKVLFADARKKKCYFPEDNDDFETLLTDINANPVKYEDCQFYPSDTVKPLTQSRDRLPFFSRGFLRAANFIVERMIGGSDAYWSERALVYVLQSQNEGGGWYGTPLSVMAINLLQKAKQAGLGDFQAEIDRGWTGILAWRNITSEGFEAQALQLSGIWDTASVLNAFESSGGIALASQNFSQQGTVEWLLAHAIQDQGNGGASWGFDPTDSKVPDVDDTANVIHSLANSSEINDPRVQNSVLQGLDWVLARQNKNGGFPAWTKGGSPFMAKMANGILKMPMAQDLSQADITGRVLFMLNDVEPWARGDLLARLQAARKSACNFLGTKLPKVKGLPIHAQPGHWMTDYTYSVAGTLVGLTYGHCFQGMQEKSAEWLMSVQDSSGGWGESPASYAVVTYVPAPPTLSQTGAVLVGLISYAESEQKAGRVVSYALTASIDRGVNFLVNKSLNGTQPVEKEYTCVLLKGGVYARYELLPAYTLLYALGRWSHLRQISVTLP